MGGKKQRDFKYWRENFSAFEKIFNEGTFKSCGVEDELRKLVNNKRKIDRRIRNGEELTDKRKEGFVKRCDELLNISGMEKLKSSFLRSVTDKKYEENRKRISINQSTFTELNKMAEAYDYKSVSSFLNDLLALNSGKDLITMLGDAGFVEPASP